MNPEERYKALYEKLTDWMIWYDNSVGDDDEKGEDLLVEVFGEMHRAMGPAKIYAYYDNDTKRKIA